MINYSEKKKTLKISWAVIYTSYAKAEKRPEEDKNILKHNQRNNVTQRKKLGLSLQQTKMDEVELRTKKIGIEVNQEEMEYKIMLTMTR